MLRDLPPYSPSHAYLTPPTPDQTMQEPSPSPPPPPNMNDDIFGSAPNSPTLEPRLDSPHTHQDPSSATTNERSDIPRLRTTHVTSGYRDGIAASKAQFVQEGFDEGYALGAVLGLKVGWCLGALEGVSRALGQSGDSGDVVREVMAVREEARAELDMRELFGKEWFGEDGVWLYDVKGTGKRDGDGDVTFREVADAHPVLSGWVVRVKDLASRLGLDLEARRWPDEDAAEEEEQS